MADIDTRSTPLVQHYAESSSANFPSAQNISFPSPINSHEFVAMQSHAQIHDIGVRISRLISILDVVTAAESLELFSSQPISGFGRPSSSWEDRSLILHVIEALSQIPEEEPSLLQDDGPQVVSEEWIRKVLRSEVVESDDLQDWYESLDEQ